uniref:Putative secreted protein n=1 Tax=Rhipicephalus microplus TaxID=6941 RepID=A0A6G5A2Z1_RHIMP
MKIIVHILIKVAHFVTGSFAIKRNSTQRPEHRNPSHLFRRRHKRSFHINSRVSCSEIVLSGWKVSAAVPCT